MVNILVVDDDPTFNKMLSTFLMRNNYAVENVFSSKSALEELKNSHFDIVLTDFKLPDLDGLELIEAIKKQHPQLPIILMTTYRDIRTAVKSIQMGAFEFVTKPVNPDEILLLIESALKSVPSADANSRTNKAKEKADQVTYIVGKSKSAEKMWEHIELVAPTKMSVLILGESGTGKEYAAKMIHDKSKRKSAPFIAIDCGALTKDLAASELFGHKKGAFTGAVGDKKGAFEIASGGTLFLDEIGNLTYEVQMQLLRVLQERKVKPVGSEQAKGIDVRIVAATNDTLDAGSKDREFRQDLYHRLNEFTIKIQPLRNRKDDLDEFFNHFLNLAATELEKTKPKISNEAYNVLVSYHWPGNLREMRNIIRRAVLLSTNDKIDLAQLPQEIVHAKEDPDFTNEEGVNADIVDLKVLKETNEREMIIRVLKETRYNKSKAAAILNIDRKTLYNKLKLYEIDI
jgi:two-component system response regulator HydG